MILARVVGVISIRKLLFSFGIFHCLPSGQTVPFSPNSLHQIPSSPKDFLSYILTDIQVGQEPNIIIN